MGDRANVIVVRETGPYELYRTGRAVGIDLYLLDGLAAVLAMLPELRRDGGRAGREAVAGNTVAARHPASLVWRRQGSGCRIAAGAASELGSRVSGRSLPCGGRPAVAGGARQDGRCWGVAL
ncbi:hypothetical protein [Streptomyces sp. NPDC058202]|uniref:hypothetical protein n=1 Tax=Streptomyces sp. NPDC058202 TaxID=3346380 RepID=UPI0036E47705